MTGVRCGAARLATFAPTPPEPVNRITPNGSAERCAPKSGPPQTTPTSSASRCAATSAAISSAVRGVISEGFISVGQPAESAEISGISASCSG
jgi:hypothetical protein